MSKVPLSQKLLALFSYVLFGLVVLLAVPVHALLLAVTFPFDKNRKVVGRSLRLTAVLIGKICPLWHLRMEPSPHRPEGAAVVVANHESMLDIFLISGVPWEMKWVAKDVIFKIPWFGWLFHMSGDIPVNRSSKESGAEVMARADRYLARGMPVMFFPEGKRSTTDELRPFKLGAFVSAIRAGVPILPIAVHGTKAGMPHGSPWIGRTRAKGRVLAPIPTKGLKVEDAEQLAARVREVIIAARDSLQLEAGTRPVRATNDVLTA